MPPLAAPYTPIVHPEVVPPLGPEGHALIFDRTHVAALRYRQVNEKEAFTFIDAVGVAYRASLKSLTDTDARAVVYEKFARSPESPLDLTLICAVLSRQRMTPVMQKATELGVTRIVPVLTDKSVSEKDLAHEKPWGWQGQVLRAVKQCRRASVPLLSETQPLAKLLRDPKIFSGATTYVLDDRAPSLLDAHEASKNPVILAVGPEGGWSETERDAFTRLGARELAMGGRILRAETAVFVGLTLLQAREGDLR